MTAELRIVGDKLVLFTDDNQVYRRFRQGIRPLYERPYIQHGNLVAYDLYFEKKQRRAIVRVMKGQFSLNFLKVSKKPQEKRPVRRQRHQTTP